jgi:hypothetical protein
MVSGTISRDVASEGRCWLPTRQYAISYGKSCSVSSKLGWRGRYDVRHRFSIIAFLLLLWGAPGLRSQIPGEFVLVARRTGGVEVLDALTLQTVGQLHFDLSVEKLSANPDGAALYVDGYSSGPCCRHFALDLATLILTEIPGPPDASRSRDSFGNPQISPDGRWRFELKSFRGPALRTIDLSTGDRMDLAPSALPLTEEACGGNWYAQGAWSGDRFYFYVACPNHPGFLWTVSPGAHELGAGIQVAPFAGNSACRSHLPVVKSLAAAAGKLFLYESFGSKFDRTPGCAAALSGGAWILDPATGQLSGPVAPGMHFNRLAANRSGSMLYGIDPGDAAWRGPVRLVALESQAYRVIQSRTFDAGVLQISIGVLRGLPSGDVRMEPPAGQ